MDVFDQLKEALETAQAEQDLPDYLAEQIRHLIENRESYRDREDELADLVEKVTLYDTYGQTGYLGMGVNNIILGNALKRFLY